VSPAFDLRVPLGFEDNVAAHQEAFPEDAAGFREFFELQDRFHREGLKLAMSTNLAQLGEAVDRLPTFFAYRNATLGDVVAAAVRSEPARAALGSVWPYWGVPPSRLAFAASSPFLGTVMRTGAWSCRGGFGQLADALASGCTRHGGELRYGTAVESIEMTEGKATGVVLDGGRLVHAPTVISNVDGLRTFERMIGAEHLPRRMIRRLAKLQPTLSAVVAFAATGLDLRALGAAEETFLYPHVDHDENYRAACTDGSGAMWASVPSLADPSLAPAGEHILTLTTLAPIDADKDAVADRMLSHFEASLFPGLRDSLTFYEVAGPRDIQRLLGGHEGAIYGWAMTPGQIGSKRLPRSGVVDGLWLAGHWTEEGSGAFRAILSGVTTAQMILRSAGAEIDPAMFRPDDMPQVG
jgi:prolycopene isomerase